MCHLSFLQGRHQDSSVELLLSARVRSRDHLIQEGVISICTSTTRLHHLMSYGWDAINIMYKCGVAHIPSLQSWMLSYRILTEGKVSDQKVVSFLTEKYNLKQNCGERVWHPQGFVRSTHRVGFVRCKRGTGARACMNA